jgi:uncharacterized protein YeeX (DUF496 family)
MSKNFDKETTEKINNTISEFHRSVFSILKICRKIEPGNILLESLQKRIGFARDFSPFIIIDKCKDKVWVHREYIINEDENFFLQKNFSSYIKEDENKSFINDMITLIKSKYQERSTAEKKELWRHIKLLLKYVTQYKVLINDAL